MHNQNTLTPAADLGYWGMPVRYTIASQGGLKLYATQDGTTRTVATLRAADDASARQIAEDLNALVGLLDLRHIRHQLDALAASGVDTSTVSNLGAERDPRVGITLSPSRLLDIGPVPAAGTSRGVGDALLRLLAAIRAEPDASARALRTELTMILTPLEGTVVRGEYEGDCTDLNLAPWLDSLTDEQIEKFLLDDHAHDALCWDILGTWSNPGGILEDQAMKIESDSDFKLLVNRADVIRRLAGRRPHLLAKIYTPEHLEKLAQDPWAEEEVETAALFVSTETPRS